MSQYPTFEVWNEPARGRRGMPVWGWVLIVVGVLVVLPCVGLVSFVMYLGIAGPDTAVYAGNRVPTRFVNRMRDVGALEEGEQLVYFYSDAVVDIRSGFYFVSDRGVVVYSKEVTHPLTRVAFERIADAELSRNESFFIDSEIVLTLDDGSLLAFPVSSENDGDVRFHEAIRHRMTR